MTATIELWSSTAANITMEDIVTGQVTRGAVHHHFETREDLWAATQRELMARMDDDLNFQHAAKLDVTERINIVLDSYWSVFGGPLFLASLEIRAFGRLNLKLRKRIQDEFEITGNNRDRLDSISLQGHRLVSGRIENDSDIDA
jgi:AcrR family transcriptional regulator